MKELLDFVEGEARVNAAFHIANADILQKESNTLLNLLLAGAGGALALTITMLQKPTPVPLWQIMSTASAAAYLFAVAGFVIWRCLWVEDIWPPANEPKNFSLDLYSVDQLRRFDLDNKQYCCDLNRVRNEGVGSWLNRCRALAAMTSLFVGVSATIAGWVA